MFVFGHSEVAKEAGDFGKGRNPHPRTDAIDFPLVLGKRQVNVLPTCMEETIRACPDRLTLPPYVERPAWQELFQSISYIGTVRSYVRPLRAAHGRWP
ncbi:hypothetical protein [Rhizobium lusitanum]|jgi:hypothetical protein|uniref:Uncharacterized protein n=1 Tax=Rhizobium lusitanum TaxID=293958 RepID=A0A1C3W924_9HYPH|nr:hypothetical protein [Rhizobium lusitanum]SCB36234.1 hypothetical protein GA0061101_10936 [Rhizobium lusitanum]